MRKTRVCLLIVFSLVFMNVTPCKAIDTYLLCPSGIGDRWKNLLAYNNTIIGTGILSHEDVRAVHMLAEHGFKIGMGGNLWGELPLESSHAIDIYYNESLREKVYRTIDQVFDVDPAEGLGVNPERVYSFVLGDEEGPAPEWAPSVIRYNESFHAETGLWMTAPNPTLDEVLYNWIGEKTVWVYNNLYDYVKTKWPHLEVSQAWLADLVRPGLKSDTWSGGGYLTGGTNNPWTLYHSTRFSRTHSPNSSVGAVIWGTQDWPMEWGDTVGGFENMRTHAWVTYLSGIDHIAWFDMHPELGWGWERNDTLGKRLFLYQQRLNEELNKLPTIHSQPRVLVVGFIGAQELNFLREAFLFHEYDWTWEQFIAYSDMNLSKYDLIIIGEWTYYDETVKKLNDYVSAGGNLAFIGGLGYYSYLDPVNVYENATRSTRFFIEEEARNIWGGGHTTLNISTPNLLNLDLNYDALSSSIGLLQTSNISGNYHSIGEFYSIDEYGAATLVDGYPLVLYHNASSPSDGYTLCFGYRYLSTESEPIDEYSHENQQFTRQVIREVIQAFCRNFLGFNDTITTPETEYLLITQGMLEDGSILAGISNFFQNWSYTYIPVERDIDYKLNLDRFDLTDGDYWVHSLDKNESIGQFTSLNSVLTVPLHVDVNATRLLLISAEKPSPDYSINIFPPIPTPEEVEGPSFIAYLENLQESTAEPSVRIPVPVFLESMLGFILVIPLLVHWRRF